MSVLTGRHDPARQRVFSGGTPTVLLPTGRIFRLLTLCTCIQGFVLAAIATLVGGAAAAGIPIGRLLDVTAPGLLLAMGVGWLGRDAWIWQSIYSQRGRSHRPQRTRSDYSP
jgi:hypothetical protein